MSASSENVLLSAIKIVFFVKNSNSLFQFILSVAGQTTKILFSFVSNAAITALRVLPNPMSSARINLDDPANFSIAIF